MSAIVTSAIDEFIASLAREVPTPVEPFGYGSDLSCTDDLTPTCDEVDPFSARALAEALYRRITTARGSLPDDLDYGLDVRGFLNRGTTAGDLAQIAGQIRVELQKDDRVDRVSVQVTAPAIDTLSIAALVTPIDVNLGRFTLTLAVTSAQTIMEAIT